MEIKTFTIADLKTVLLSADFWLAKTLPITKHRMLSYIHNPRANEDDLVLLVAYQDNQVIGYLGILPDRLYAHDATYKIGWLTSWWVDPFCAATGVGAILLFKALNAYDQYLGVSGGSREARKALDASRRFIALKTLQGLEIKFRFNLTRAFSHKLPTLKIFRSFFKVLDITLNEIVNLRSFFWQRRNSICRRLAFEYIPFIDEETGCFIERHHQHDLTRKGKAELNWMMTYPWIVSAPLKDSVSRRYYFSSCSDRFLHLSVKVFARNGGMVGFFMLKVRDDRMSVVYAYFEGQHAPSIAAAVVYHALAMDVCALSIYDERLVESVSALRCPYWSAKKVARGFLLSKVLADISSTDCRLHGGDGDFVFY